jgi:hypothetical protein
MKNSFYILLLVFIFAPYLATGQQPSVYRVTRESFSSSAYSDISPVIVEDGIIFCSDRRFSALKDRKTFEGERIYSIYKTERKDTSDWRTPSLLKGERTMLFNSGPLSFAPDKRTVYFTSDVETGKAVKKRNFRNRSGIFIADYDGTRLGSVRPFEYNSSDYNTGHPSVSADGKYLFFASDMPGGQGGSDIYFCEWVNGSWTKPINLGPKVNSQSAENYPYIHPSGRLYFSSARPGGLGRMDVYYTMLVFGEWDTPSSMPEPINSPDDDFAFVADENLQNGYFSSNRERTDDIFRFTSTIIRKAQCDTLIENNYCYEFLEANAIKWDTIPFRYQWKFGDGATATGNIVEHCYAGPGSYLVQLDVVNLVTKEVLYNEKTYNLEIRNIEQPYISGPEEAAVNQRIRFSAEETNLPGWQISRYYWNFGDETIAIGKEVDKVYLRPGVYNMQLIVSTEPDASGFVREACVCKNIIIGRQP